MTTNVAAVRRWVARERCMHPKANMNQLLRRMERLEELLALDEAAISLGERTTEIDRLLFPVSRKPEPFHKDAPRPPGAPLLTTAFAPMADGSDPAWGMAARCADWAAEDRERALAAIREP